MNKRSPPKPGDRRLLAGNERAPHKPGPTYKPIPGYTCMCGWCGKVTQVVTNGRMRVCGECGH